MISFSSFYSLSLLSLCYSSYLSLSLLRTPIRSSSLSASITSVLDFYFYRKYGGSLISNSLLPFLFVLFVSAGPDIQTSRIGSFRWTFKGCISGSYCHRLFFHRISSSNFLILNVLFVDCYDFHI